MTVWSCLFQAELKKTTGEGFGGFGHFVMSLITFGIYPIYWSFVVGRRLEKQGLKNDGIIYLLLTLFGFGPIAYLLMQNEANKVASV